MRIHHLLVVALLLLGAFSSCSCDAPPTQTGQLCTGEPQPQKPEMLLPVSWGRAIYVPSKGVEFHADVVDVAPDGVAELLITGMAETPAHDSGESATYPESITVAAPCLHWAGPAAMQRPLGVAWAWPTDKASDARAGAYAGTLGDGSIRVAVGGDPVDVKTLPPLVVDGPPVWIPDPSAKMSASAAAWEKACRAP